MYAYTWGKSIFDPEIKRAMFKYVMGLFVFSQLINRMEWRRHRLPSSFIDTIQIVYSLQFLVVRLRPIVLIEK